MTFAKVYRHSFSLVSRKDLLRHWPFCENTGTKCTLVPSSNCLHRCVSTSTCRSMLKVVNSCRLISVSAATTSIVSLLILGAVREVSTPLYTSHRHHSDSEAESDSEGPHTQQQPVMQKPQLSSRLKAAKEEAVYGMLVADAVAMPVHWYYNPDDIKRDFGKWLTGYSAPKSKHPSSILNLSAIDGSGRGSGPAVPLIGNIILHDKAKFWKMKSTHYHHGMSPGDNTLNSVSAIEMLKSMTKVDPDLTKPDRDVRAAVLVDYVKFMTTPGTHNDTYAESFHRSFFKEWVRQVPPPTSAEELIKFAEHRTDQQLAAVADSQLAVIGSFVPAIPWIIRSAHKTENECALSTAEFIRLTHPVSSLIPFVDTYARLLHAVLNGHDLKTEVLKVLANSNLGGPSKRQTVLQLQEECHKYPKGSEERLRMYQMVTSMLGSACYVEGAMSSMLFLALEFHDDFMAGVLANANCGGENCHRGAALGALLAAAAANRGEKIPAVLRDNLHSMKPVAAAVVSDMSQI